MRGSEVAVLMVKLAMRPERLAAAEPILDRALLRRRFAVARKSSGSISL